MDIYKTISSVPEGGKGLICQAVKKSAVFHDQVLEFWLVYMFDVY